MNSELKLDAKEKDWLVLGYHPVDRRFSACKSSRKRATSIDVTLHARCQPCSQPSVAGMKDIRFGKHCDVAAAQVSEDLRQTVSAKTPHYRRERVMTHRVQRESEVEDVHDEQDTGRAMSLERTRSVQMRTTHMK